MTEILFTAVIATLIGLTAWREQMNARERDRLLDRLMSRDLPEYKDNVAPPEPNQPEEEPDETVELEEAMEEISDYGGRN